MAVTLALATILPAAGLFLLVAHEGHEQSLHDAEFSALLLVQSVAAVTPREGCKTLPQALLPPDCVLFIADRDGACLCCLPEKEPASLCDHIPQELTRKIADSGGQGVAQLTETNGDKRIYAFAKLLLTPEDTSYRAIIVGVPEKTWLSSANMRFTRDMLVLPLLFLWALVIAWIPGARMFNALIKVREQRRDNADRMIRHNLKSSLANLAHIPALLLKDDNFDERQRYFLTMMYEASRRMSHNLDMFLTLCKIEDGTYRNDMPPFDLAAAANLVVREAAPHARSYKVGLTILLDQTPLDEGSSFPLQGDEDLAIVILEHLIENAIEASPPEKTVLVSLDSRARTLVIRNTGEVPPSIRNRFFEKYVTEGKKRGNGLGTYTAWRMATALGWDIRLDTSTAGQTSIWLHFPPN